MNSSFFRHNLVSYFSFAFIAMVGTSYLNFLPALVSTFANGLNFNEVQSGEVVASNGYGALVGSIIAINLVRKVQWKSSIALLLLLLIGLDIGTAWVTTYESMLTWRFAAGVVGGLCMGITFAVLAKLPNTDKAFGSLLFVQFSIGAIVIVTISELEYQFGSYSIFYVMAGLSVTSLFLIFFLPKHLNSSPIPINQPSSVKQTSTATLLMLALFIFNCAASGIWAYAELIGTAARIELIDVNNYIASTSMLGLLGALVAIVTGKSFGRLPFVTVGTALSTVAALTLYITPVTDISFICALALLFFSWTAVLSYLLATAADMDPSGRLSAISSVVSLAGNASGPLLAASLLNNQDFSYMLLASALLFLISIFLFRKPVIAMESSEQTSAAVTHTAN